MSPSKYQSTQPQIQPNKLIIQSQTSNTASYTNCNNTSATRQAQFRVKDNQYYKHALKRTNKAIYTKACPQPKTAPKVTHTRPTPIHKYGKLKQVLKVQPMQTTQPTSKSEANNPKHVNSKVQNQQPIIANNHYKSTKQPKSATNCIKPHIT